jgi:Spy/CpxP family protein refolding chaperone
MRRMILAVTALSLAAAPATTQAQTPRPERGGMMGGMMGGMRGGTMGPMVAQGALGNPAARVLEQREALALTSAQVRQLQQLEAQHEARTQPLIEQLQAERPGIMARGAMGRGAAQLTPEQREQMRSQMQEQRVQMQERREQMQERREQMQERREQMRQAAPEQREQMRARMQAEMKAQREQRAAAIANPALRAQMQALHPIMEQLQQSRQQTRQEVVAVLTAEQHARLQELQSQRGVRMWQGMGERPSGQQGPRRGGFQR